MTQFDPPEKAVFDLLSNPYRRHIVRILAQQETAITVSGLAEKLPPIETRETEADTDAASLVSLRLHHIDLPKLAHFGAIEYDPSTGRVRATDGLFALERRLDDINAERSISVRPTEPGDVTGV